MYIIFAIAAGGALGALSRYAIIQASIVLWGSNFPFGTIIVNIMGCFFLGILIAFFLSMDSYSQELRSFLTVGFLGSMTTFSTFSSEGLTLINNGNYSTFLIYTLVSVILGLLAVYLGAVLSK